MIFRLDILASIGAVILGVLAYGAGSALAQTPPAGASNVFPFTVVLSGPATARAGDTVTYSVTYDNTRPDSNVPPAFVFVFPPADVELLSASGVTGPKATVSNSAPDSVRFDFKGSGSGASQVVLRINPAFSGSLTVSFYVPGTQITLSRGSVQSFTTAVAAAETPAAPPAPPAAGDPGSTGSPATSTSSGARGLPNTGAGNAGDRSIAKEPLAVLGLAGAVVLWTGVLTASRRRCTR